MSSDPVVILAARRTPVGAFQGVFAGVTAPQLGSAAIKAAIADSGVAPSEIEEVIMGCVLSAGLGQAPARQAALGAGVPASVPATTVNKMCGSAMRAVMLAADQIQAGSARVLVAGGFESMTNAPYLLPKARAGYRMGHQEVLDHMFFDGLQSPWDGQTHGLLCRGDLRPSTTSRARHKTISRESRCAAHKPPSPAARLRGGGAGDGQDAQRRGADRQGRDAVHARCVEDSVTQAGLQKGRHRDGRQFREHLRRCGGPRVGARILGQGAGPEAAGAHPGLFELRQGAGVVHAGARRRDPKIAGPVEVARARTSICTR